MPSRVPPPTAPSPQGSFPPVALFVAAIAGTTIPSDSRCARCDLAIGLYASLCPDVGPRRRVSPVPHRALHTCRAPYPGRTRGGYGFGLPHRERGLRRDMLGSAPALFICRGGRLPL